MKNYYVGDIGADYIYSKEERIKALKLRYEYFFRLKNNLMNIAIELLSIKKQLEKEGVVI